MQIFDYRCYRSQWPNQIINRLKRQYQHGFTLIEILVVFGIGIVFTTAGLASYSRLNSVQSLINLQKEIATLLQVAKSRAQSQVKPTAIVNCNAPRVLNGYAVHFDRQGDDSYRLLVVCSNANGTNVVRTEIPETYRELPSGVIFAPSGFSGNNKYITFTVLTGEATADSVSVQDATMTRTITVSGNGSITNN
jgi:prepilin-type N-terminal cleavage/methylation domain-containing protein